MIRRLALAALALVLIAPAAPAAAQDDLARRGSAARTIGDAILCSENRYDDQGNRRIACTNLRGVDLHGPDFRAARFCTSDGRDTRSCRTVTRRELTDSAHADLTGAQAPA